MITLVKKRCSWQLGQAASSSQNSPTTSACSATRLLVLRFRGDNLQLTERLVGGETPDGTRVLGDLLHQTGLEQGVDPHTATGQAAVEEALGGMKTATFDTETYQHLTLLS